jgi:NADH-quinone oxidoreductase subunit J
MTIAQVLFILVSIITLVAGFMVVTARNLVRAALWLVATLFFISVIFVLMNANFIAAVQIVIYIGAIAILFIFAVMLTRRVMQDTGPQSNKNWWLGALLSLLSFAGLTTMILGWGGSAAEMPRYVPNTASIQVLGLSLVSTDQYVIPFELASVLLLAALIGAVAVAWERK